jgi:DNA (cytosine-5)-methyltransferase 1
LPESISTLGEDLKALDLFCGAGGASMGLHRAGLEVVGVDINPQPRYPFEFHQSDAMTFPLDGFDFIWASPPCQHYCALNVMKNARKHPDLVGPVRDRLRRSGTPWVIENVFGAPLLNPTMLCGSFFGLESNGFQLRRHRYFESSFHLPLTPSCSHYLRTLGVYGAKVRDIAQEKRHYAKDKGTRGKPVGVVLPHSYGFEAMGIDWMNIEELALSIPPAYSEFIANAFLDSVGRADALAGRDPVETGPE